MKPSALLLLLVLTCTADLAWGQRYADPRPVQHRSAARMADAPRAPVANPRQVAPISFDEYVALEDEELPAGDGGVGGDTGPYFEANGVADEYVGTAGDFGPTCDTCGGRCPGDCRRRNYLSPLNGGWANFDYLVWWGKGTQLPPLATTAPSNAPSATLGALGAPGTQILFGNERVDNGARSGGRIDAGIWLDQTQEFGVGASFLGLERAGTVYDARANSGGFPVLARPFFDEQTGANNAQVIANPGVTTGVLHIQTANTIFGAEAYLRERLLEEPGYRLDVTYGYRMMRIDESVSIYDSTVSIDPLSIIPLGTELVGEDVFNTQNTFQGGQIGLISRAQRGCWGWDWIGKLAVGNIYQVATIRGNTVLTIPEIETLYGNGSLYAQPTNIGRYSRNVFGFIPELGVNVHYQFSPLWRVKVGYTFLYFNNMLQAARTIDESVNPTQIDGPLVGPARPAFNFASDSYWLQGLNFSLECQF